MMKLRRSGGMIAGFLLSETSVTVYSAIIATPIVLGIVSRHIPSFGPTWIVLAVLGFVLFTISSFFGGYVRAIIGGVAVATFLNALLSTRLGTGLSARLSGVAGQSG